MNQLAYHKPSTRYEWETPDSVFAPLNAEFNFTLDPCCTEQNAKCNRFYTSVEDGLIQDWSSDTVFMNPPYGREIIKWMKKAYESSLQGATVVCLVPARTCSGWWHEYAMEGEVRFVRGRIKFVGAKHNAPFPCAIVIFRP